MEGQPGENLTFSMQRGSGFIDGKDGVCINNVLATYTHIHALGTPSWATALVKVAGDQKIYKPTQAALPHHLKDNSEYAAVISDYWPSHQDVLPLRQFYQLTPRTTIGAKNSGCLNFHKFFIGKRILNDFHLLTGPRISVGIWVIWTGCNHDRVSPCFHCRQQQTKHFLLVASHII